MKKRALVVCPGRGSYTKETLGYLKQFAQHIPDFITDIDQRRKEIGEPTITELDSAETFKAALHTKGEHASPLIYACAYADYTSIDTDRYDVVAVAGNSMGWYITLAVGGALDWGGAFNVINTMGSMMKEEVIGGQVIYPVVDENWVKNPAKEKEVMAIAEKINSREGHEVYISIRLGGYIVFGGNKNGISALLKELPPQENYPFQLINHAAFHTPLLEETSRKAFEMLPESLFQKPKVPLIDGRGVIWQPYSTDVSKLYDYTLGHQVVKPYDFSQSVIVGLKEFCPDCIILLGPGNTLGGSLGQIMIEIDWQNLKSKADFSKRQTEDPILLAMGKPDQRNLVIK
jgi:acyl transferase domain-containing protein